MSESFRRSPVAAVRWAFSRFAFNASNTCWHSHERGSAPDQPHIGRLGTLQVCRRAYDQLRVRYRLIECWVCVMVALKHQQVVFLTLSMNLDPRQECFFARLRGA